MARGGRAIYDTPPRAHISYMEYGYGPRWATYSGHICFWEGSPLY